MLKTRAPYPPIECPVQIGSRMFSNALAELGIPHSFEIYEGADHGSKIRQRIETRTFAFFSEKLDFEPPK